MQVVVRGKHIEVQPRLRILIEEKVAKLTRHLENINKVEVEVTQEETRSNNDRYTIQMTLSVGGHFIRGEESAADTQTALDRVLSKVDHQISRYKGKLYQRNKVSAAKSVGAEADAHSIQQLQQEINPRQVVKTKTFMAKPMDEEEAVEQMELLGHSFYLFYNISNNNLNVLYRREEGGYGLLIPELG